MTESMDESNRNKPDAAKLSMTEVRYVHSENLADLLTQLDMSLFISTYQAGKLVVVGVNGGKLHFSFHSFEQVMGLAISPERLAVGTRRQITFLPSSPQLAPRINPTGTFDACFLSRLAHLTGPIQIHELAWGKEELWIVNTLFSCLCTLDRETSFIPRWKPPFISQLTDEDRCHLNSLAMEDGMPRFVTCLSETDSSAGWRRDKISTGCVVDVPSGETIARGLCMPHSIRLQDRRIWFLNSGFGNLSILEPSNGKITEVARFSGYTRGLAFRGPIAVVGQSRIRETNVFGGLPIGEHREQLKCGISIIDVRTGRQLGHLFFETGVEEIFDVQILPGFRCPAIAGPDQESDSQSVIWLSANPRYDI